MEQPAVEVHFKDLKAQSMVPVTAARGFLTIGTALQHGTETALATITCREVRERAFAHTTTSA